ncbi:MAG: hypothetical protein ACD_76C00042G0007 [uncultured bacterium]|nr:MAG: hypothetical protein ACD_76C00042G0007 [uncultured bacterium]HBD05461.1 hypothetical protein [Candidatus Uhrbacteria bacterium]
MEKNPQNTSVTKEKPVRQAKSAQAVPVVVHSVRLYRRIAVTFMALAIIMIAAVLYLSLSKATITVVPAQLTVAANFIADIVKDPEVKDDISGKVVSVVVSGAKEFNVSSEGAKQTDAKAAGEVIIKNEYSRSQPLVATTRLLSSGGILFRLVDTVTVPSAGEVSASVLADSAGIGGNIEPSRFTIPGLSEQLQKYIYAESSQAMTGGVVYRNVLTQADLDSASEQLTAELLEAAKKSIAEQMGEETFSGVSYFTEAIDKKTDTELGAETDKFAVELNLRVVGVFFDRNALLDIAEAKLYEQVPAGFDMVNISKDNLKTTVEKYDAEAGIANVRVELEGKSVVSITSDILNRGNLISKSPSEASAMLEASDAIESAQVDLWPFWLTKTPRLKDHIEIRVVLPESK